MARALVDFDAEIFNGDPSESAFARGLGTMFDALSVFGLKVVGSAPSPIFAGPDVVRLVVEDGPVPVLPAECRDGWRIVSVTFELETHGDQRITRVRDVKVSGTPRLALAA